MTLSATGFRAFDPNTWSRETTDPRGEFVAGAVSIPAHGRSKLYVAIRISKLYL